jgi:eukaryotic-like serine/threonine-protein kinase
MLREDDIFAEALTRTDPGERAAYLARACAGHAGLQAQLEELLRGHEQAEDFLATPLTPRPFPPQETPGQRIGRYTLVEKIGEGGCGIVWRARQDEPVRRDVALKVIKLGMDTREVIARFDAERQALALMDHPNIARVFDGGATDTGRPYFVMELVRGLPITRFCDERQLTVAQRLALFIPVCQAVQHAHQKGIIHRDLKPSNILVSDAAVWGSGRGGPDDSRSAWPGTAAPVDPREPGAPMPKVIDFGIAKATQGRLTEHTLYTAVHHFIGTPVYMSPEQAEAGTVDIDTRSDIYSLGVLLYELLSGATPFERGDFAPEAVEQIRRQIRIAPPVRLSSRHRAQATAARASAARARGTTEAFLGAQLRGDLEWIVMRCLETDRSRRYETANGLALDLQRFLRREPVVARPPSFLYILQRLIDRHRVVFWASGGLAAGLVLAVFVSTAQAIRARRAEREQARLLQSEASQRRRAEHEQQAARRRAYAADINLAQHALALDDLGRASELLAAHRPTGGEPDLRDWEWRYLWQFCQSDQTVLLARRPGSSASLAVSGDGTFLALGGTDLLIRDFSSGRELHVPGPVSRLAFASHGPLLLTAGPDPSAPGAGDPPVDGDWLRLCDASTGNILRTWRAPGACRDLSFSADGTTLFTASTTPAGRINIWRTADGTAVASFSVPLAGEVVWSLLALTGDHRQLAHAAPGGRVRVIDPATGAERYAIQAAEHEVTAVAFSPDARILATSGASGSGLGSSPIVLWDAATGVEIGRLEGNREHARHLLFSADGRRLFSAGRDQTVRMWAIEDRRLLATFRGHQKGVSRLALLPDGCTLISRADDGTVRSWNYTRRPARPAATQAPARLAAWRFAAERQTIWAVDRTGRFGTWSAGGTRWLPASLRVAPAEALAGDVLIAGNAPLVAAAWPDGAVRVWDGVRQTLVAELPDAGRPLAFREQGRKLLATRAGDSVAAGLEEWDLAAGTLLRRWPVRGGANFVLGPDENHCWFCTATGATRRIDLRSGQEDESAAPVSRGLPLVFSPDGRLIVAAAPGNMDPPWIWDAETMTLRAKLSSFSFGARSGAFSPNGRRLLTGGANGFEAVVLRDAEGFHRLLTLEARGILFQSVAMSPDGNAIGAMTYAGALFLWHAPNWSEIAAAEKNGTNF